MENLTASVYYGLHFGPGVAEYSEQINEQGNPKRIYINEQTAKQMDKSFHGKPVFLGHPPKEIDKKDFTSADGYVAESFFNKSDGFHWAKFLITSEKAEKKIQAGYRLSNAYFTIKQNGPGEWHGVPFDSEVVSGRYEHLAIVNSPRYEESVIYTPEEFKAYNEKREAELEKIANVKTKKKENKKGEEGMFKFFTKEVVKNSKDFENTLVTLPGSDVTMSISDLVTNMDAIEVAKNEAYHCNGDEMVKVGNEEMTVKDMKKSYMQMKKNIDDMKKENEEDDEKKENDDEKEGMENEDEDDKKSNKSKKNMDDDKDAKKSNKNSFNKLKNAEQNATQDSREAVTIVTNGLSLGQERYGSGS